MSDDVTVLEDEIEAYADNTVARIRVLDIPESDKFPKASNTPSTTAKPAATTPSFDSTTTTASTNSTPAPTSTGGAGQVPRGLTPRPFTKSTTPNWTPSIERGGRHSPERNAPTGSH